MVSQSDFPPIWSEECEGKGVRVEVGVHEGDGNISWIEIPTTDVETNIAKGETASIKRATEVKFLSPWGDNVDSVRHNEPRKLIEHHRGEDQAQLTYGRVYYEEDTTAEETEWVCNHIGWIGGVGGTSSSGVFRFWIYDFADVLDNAAITLSLNDPTLRYASGRLGKLCYDFQIPVKQVFIAGEDSPETTITVFGEDANINDIELPGVGPYTHLYDTIDFFSDGAVDISGAEDTLPTGGGLTDPLDLASKKFQRNHDTLADLWTWIEKKGNAKLHFEPAPDEESVILVVDVGDKGRQFTQYEVAQEIQSQIEATESTIEGLAGAIGINADVDLGTYAAHDIVSVVENNALNETVPINTLTIRGDTTKRYNQAEGPVDAFSRGLIGRGGTDLIMADYDTEFPKVTAESPSLKAAAGGAELGPALESNTKQLSALRGEAKKELRERITSTSNGEITMDGEPDILPFDKIDAFETCPGLVETQPYAVTYEVQQVRHYKKSDGFYTTEAMVSVAPEDIVITEATIEGVGGAS